MRVVQKAKDKARFPPEVPFRDLPLSPANIPTIFTPILSDYEGHKNRKRRWIFAFDRRQQLTVLTGFSVFHELHVRWTRTLHLPLTQWRARMTATAIVKCARVWKKSRKYQSAGINLEWEKGMSQEKWSICSHKPYYITFNNAEDKTHLPSSRHTYLALRKSAVMYRVDCKGVAGQRKSGGLLPRPPPATWQMHLQGCCCKVWQDSSVVCQMYFWDYLWSRWV